MIGNSATALECRVAIADLILKNDEKQKRKTESPKSVQSKPRQRKSGQPKSKLSKRDSSQPVRSKEYFEKVFESLGDVELSKTELRTFTLEVIVNQLLKKKINLFPEYQRGFVWNPAKSSRLIVTLLQNRIIHPLILHETSPGRYDVVDGKQRLISIYGFYFGGSNGAELEKKAEPNVKKELKSIIPQLETLSKLDDEYEYLNGCS